MGTIGRCPCDESFQFTGEDEDWIEVQERMKTNELGKASVDTFLKNSAFGQEKDGVVAMEKPEFKELKKVMGEIAACVYTSANEPVEGGNSTGKRGQFRSDIFGSVREYGI